MTNSGTLTNEACLAVAAVVRRGQLEGRLDVDAFNKAVVGASIDRHTGLRIQLAVLEHHQRSGEALAGWKVGLTSGPGRDKMGEGYRPFGHILHRQTYTETTSILLPGGDVGLEPELGFILGRDLSGPDVTTEEASAAIAEVVPMFEIIQHRLGANTPHALALADNLSQWGVVLGQPMPWRQTAAATVVDLFRPDGTIDRVGPGFSIDEPSESLAALARMLHRHGQQIRAGQFVITGAFLKVPVTAGVWTARFSTAGDVVARFV